MKDSRPTLFYSWQSDDPKTRYHIESALKKALVNVAKDMSVEAAPRLDKDTQGEVGAVSITATIKRKISDSKIFIADVSLIDSGSTGRRIVNQNVMFELGYAFGKKTEQGVILVANQDLGAASELPFDIADNRIIFFSLEEDRKAEKLIRALEYAVKAHLDFVNESMIVKTQENIKQELLSAIENNKPTQTKSETFFENLYDRYLALAPERPKQSMLYAEYGEMVASAYQKTLPITLELFDVVHTAGEYGNIVTLQICYKMLGRIASFYDTYDSDEYASLLIQEVVSLIIGSLAEFEYWAAIRQLIDSDLSKPKGGIRKYKIKDTYRGLEGICQYYKQKTGQDYGVLITFFLQERFVDKDKVLRLYAAGSLILMFGLTFYYPFVSGLFLMDDDSYIPDYLAQLRYKKFAESFSVAIGVSDIEGLKGILEKKQQQALASNLGYWNTDLTHVFKNSGLLPLGEKIGSI